MVIPLTRNRVGQFAKSTANTVNSALATRWLGTPGGGKSFAQDQITEHADDDYGQLDASCAFIHERLQRRIGRRDRLRRMHDNRHTSHGVNVVVPGNVSPARHGKVPAQLGNDCRSVPGYRYAGTHGGSRQSSTPAFRNRESPSFRQTAEQTDAENSRGKNQNRESDRDFRFDAELP